MSRLRVPFYFALLCLCWGLAYVAIKFALHSSPPFALAAIRAGLGGLFLLPVSYWRKPGFPRDWFTHRSALILGLLNISIFLGFMNLGLTYVSAGESSILVYTQPIVLAPLAALVLKERLTVSRMGGLLLGFSGVVLVLADKVQPGESPHWLAYLVLLTVSLSWAVANLYFKHAQGRMNLYWVASLQALYGMIPLAVVSVLFEWGRPLVFDANLIWPLLFLALMSTSLSYSLWYYLLERGEATAVSAYVFLVPLVAALSGGIVLGERLSVLVALGGLAIVAGIYLVNRQVRRAETRAPAAPVPRLE